MADTTDPDEPALQVKRKTDPSYVDNDDYPKKSQKLGVVDSNTSSAIQSNEKNRVNFHEDEHLHSKYSAAEETNGEVRAELDAEADDDDNQDDEEDYEDDDEDEDEYDDGVAENSNGNAKTDCKGKGIMKDDKGKGKLIEEDDDDSSSSGSEFDGDESYMSDDPLAEVDLDNILPSRTRRRIVQPGVYIANNIGNDGEDSDDSDA